MKKRINKQQIFNFYNKTHKWRGIIDYKSLTAIAIYCFVSVYFVIALNITNIIKLYVITILITPMIIFVLLNINEDSVLEKLVTIIQYLFTRKIYTKRLDFIEKQTIYKKCDEKGRIEK